MAFGHGWWGRSLSPLTLILLQLSVCCLCCIATSFYEDGEAMNIESTLGEDEVSGTAAAAGQENSPVGVMKVAAAVGPEAAIRDIKKAAAEPGMVKWMSGIRRHLHAHPELSWEEFETSAFIREKLDEMKIPYEWPVAKTGVVGIVGNGNAPVVALRADMDALAIQEAGDWEHKSKVSSKMHACGHDSHVTMLLAAAKILQSRRHHFQGTVRLLFQPAEEGAAGAKVMVQEGALGKAEAIFGLHISAYTPTGTVALKSGPLLAASGLWEATIYGKGGHAAIPHHVVDPIVAAAATILVLQQIVSREADPLESQVVSASFIEAGKAFNVIPDRARLGGTFRAFSNQGLMKIKKRIEEIIVTQAAVHQCRASVDFKESDNPFYPAVVNDESLHQHVHNVATELLGEENVWAAKPITGAEDFSFYLEQIPGYFIFLGMRNETFGSTFPGHNPDYKLDENAMTHGAALMASAAETYLGRFKRP